MKLKLGPLTSDIIIVIYAVVTLYFRFKLENESNISTVNSLVIGLSFVLIIWVLIKLQILNPSWFGLFKNKEK